MTKTDFFRILIKVFGLYSVLTALLSVLPSNISFVLSYPDATGFIWLFVVTAIVFSLFFFLIRRPDFIIRILKLDKGFDEERIQFENLNAQSIIKLSSIIIGGLLIIDNIPVFFSYTLFAFKESVGHSPQSYSLKENIYWAASFIKIALGYFLVVHHQFASRLFKEKDSE
ncbi:MAG: hypothetical protein ACXVPU_10530 [Bacteroidia bacterium]